MSNFDPFGQAIGALFWVVCVLLVFVPFGVWKMVEVIIWLFTNVTIGIEVSP